MKIFGIEFFQVFLMVYVYSDTEIDQILKCTETYLWNLNLLKFFVYL